MLLLSDPDNEVPRIANSDREQENHCAGYSVH